jgi:hypothetical protein
VDPVPTILRAAVLDADPELAAARAERARTRRDVWLSPDEDGVKALIARLDAGDATFVMATVDRLAAILKVRGDTDPIGPRRAKAMGLLGRPAEAAALLAAHRHDPDPTDPGQAPTGPDPAPEPNLALRDDMDPADDEPPDDALAESEPDDDATKDDEPEGSEPGDDEPVEPGTEPIPDPRIVAEEAHVSLPLAPGVFGSLTGSDLARARPRVVLYFHLSDAAISAGSGLVRPEHGDPQTLDQLQEWLAEGGVRWSV